MEAHEASSLYSEEKAKLLRAVCGEIEVANDSMVLYLSSIQLEDIPSATSSLSLPQELKTSSKVCKVLGVQLEPSLVQMITRRS